MTSSLLPINVVAQRCAVSTRTVRRWVERGELPCVRLPGKTVRIEESALEELLEADRLGIETRYEVAPMGKQSA